MHRNISCILNLQWFFYNGLNLPFMCHGYVIMLYSDAYMNIPILYSKIFTGIHCEHNPMEIGSDTSHSTAWHVSLCISYMVNRTDSEQGKNIYPITMLLPGYSTFILWVTLLKALHMNCPLSVQYQYGLNCNLFEDVEGQNMSDLEFYLSRSPSK